MKKRFILFFLLLLSLSANADQNGQCGDNVIWSYDAATYTLTIEGNGSMFDYHYDNIRYCDDCADYYSVLNTPWPSGYKNVIIKEGVTYIGDYFFFREI